ncbi:UNVERIFIED_CONTAM: hypothetical protein FKN15_040318 [Acipenser sinensis]
MRGVEGKDPAGKENIQTENLEATETSERLAYELKAVCCHKLKLEDLTKTNQI